MDIELKDLSERFL